MISRLVSWACSALLGVGLCLMRTPGGHGELVKIDLGGSAEADTRAPVSPLLAHTCTSDRCKSFISTHIANDPRGGGHTHTRKKFDYDVGRSALPATLKPLILVVCGQPQVKFGTIAARCNYIVRRYSCVSRP